MLSLKLVSDKEAHNLLINRTQISKLLLTILGQPGVSQGDHAGRGQHEQVCTCNTYVIIRKGLS